MPSRWRDLTLVISHLISVKHRVDIDTHENGLAISENILSLFNI